MKLTTHQLSYLLDEHPLIESIDLTFEKGALHAILGINGSGKSTLLKAICHIWKPTYGSVSIDGENIASWGRRRISRTMTLVPHAPVIPFNYRVEEIVEMGRYPVQGGRHTITVQQALEKVDALSLLQRPILSISTGERQRIYIARALVSQAPILLFDEPTTNLDIRHQLEIWHLLRELADEGHIVLVATHDLAAAMTFCDTAALLHRGCCLAFGTPNVVLHKGLLEEVFGVSPCQATLSPHYCLPDTTPQLEMSCQQPESKIP